MELLRRTVTTHLNVEMASTTEMVRIAQTIKPAPGHARARAARRGDDRGGTGRRAARGECGESRAQLLDARIDVSIFVDPDLEQIRQCHKLRAPKIEINTGKYADAWKEGHWPAELDKIATAARAAKKLGLVVLAGHGLTYRNIDGIVTIPEIEELNIGHSIISRAALVGLDVAVREMAALMRHPRRLPTVK